MKTTSLFLTITVLFILNTAAGLIKLDYVKDPNQVIETLKLSTWRVSSFSNGDRDYFESYKNIELKFLDNNQFEVSNGSTIHSGIWGVDKCKNESYKKTFGVLFSMNLNEKTKLNLIEKKWRVIERNDSKIKLLCINEFNETVFFLVLEKNI